MLHTYRNQKEIFRLWFEFLKRAYQADKSLVPTKQKNRMKRIYAEWGDVELTRFDDWWESNADNLFSEPDVEVITDRLEIETFSEADYLTVVIPRNLSMQQIRKRLDQKFPKTRTQPKAKFQINTSSKIHGKEGLRYALRVYDLLQDGKKAWEVFDTIEEQDLVFTEKWKYTRRKLRESSTASKWRFRKGVDVRTPSEGDGYYRIPQLVSRNKLLAQRIIKSVSEGRFT